MRHLHFRPVQSFSCNNYIIICFESLFNKKKVKIRYLRLLISIYMLFLNSSGVRKVEGDGEGPFDGSRPTWVELKTELCQAFMPPTPGFEGSFVPSAVLLLHLKLLL